MSSPLKQPKDSSVADRLIDVAETLYGKHGIEGVSLRQISSAAGTGNNYAVQYHFGDSRGLIKAIIAKRMPLLEMERAKFLANVGGQRPLAARFLIDILIRPAIDHRDSQGNRSLARFLLAAFTDPSTTRLAFGMDISMPITVQIFEMLHAAHPEIPAPLLDERIRLAAHMVLTSIFNRLSPFDDDFDVELIDNAMEMATAAVLAPVSVSLRLRIQDLGPQHDWRGPL